MKKIIFLGAGYANLSIIKSLDKTTLKKAQFLLINNASYHYKTTQLHKLASKEKEDGIKIPLKEIIPNEITFIQDYALRIEKNKLICQNTEYDFDEIYVGLGANINTFGIEGLDSCFHIGDYENALKTKESIFKHLEDEKTPNKDIVICGAGFSGVELAGSLAEYCNKNQLDASISIVEAMDEILPMFDKKLARKARIYLEKLGVRVLTSHKITKKESNRLFLDGEIGYIDSENIIFTAGVKGNKVIGDSIFENKNNRIAVNEFLQAPGYENCYIIGDCSLVLDKNERPFAPTAQIACKQGLYLAKSLKARLNNKNFNEKFTFSNQGSVCSVSYKYAVASVNGKDFSGCLANILKTIIDKKWDYKLFGLKAFKGI